LAFLGALLGLKMEHNIDQATKNYTIFCDLDGTIWEQGDPCEIAKPGYQPKMILGSIDKIREWDSKGFKIILTTGRKESLREVTVKQLSYAGVVYDQLVMGIGGGSRVLINDLRANGDKSAFVIQPKRNEGIGGIDL
jgi:ribonucleotide monophosphatase NagD (HAD superfamily)